MTSSPPNHSGSHSQLVGFKRHLRVATVPGDAVYVLSEKGIRALRGSDVEFLVPLLDGSRDLATVCRESSASAQPARVTATIDGLVEAGLLALRAPGTDTARTTLAYWESAGLDADTAVANTAGRRVSLIAHRVDPGPATAALRAAGLTVTEPVPADQDTADLSVVLCADYLADGLAGIDDAHRVSGHPWLLARTIGARIWLGPVFTPGSGPCWTCLATRLWGNRPAEAHVRDALGLPGAVGRPTVTITPLAVLAANLVALEASKWLAGQRYPGQRQVWILDSHDLTGRHHEVRARPQCPSCGDPGLLRAQARRPVVLRSQAKAHRTSGGERVAPPEHVLDTYRHLVSPVTGVVTEIRRIQRGPAFFNSFSSGLNPARGGRGIRQLRSALRTFSGGKGTTPVQAEAGALAEALERHSGQFQGDEERVAASLRSLGASAVHPDTCLLFHPRQFRDRARWNATHGGMQFVCDPFDDDAVLDWTPVWSLTEQRHRLLPTGLLYLGVPRGRGPVRVLADSNGNAAGTSVEDAVLQGLFEIVERDAVALWWYNRTRQPGVHLDAFGDPWISELREVYSGLGREAWVLDVTSDNGVPAMVAVSRRTDAAKELIMFGFGAHLDPMIALRRALTELNQLMTTVVDGAPAGDDPDASRWLDNATVANQPYLLPDPDQPARGPADYGYRYQPDLAEDVRTVQARLTATGLDILVLDQTRPDIGMPVVKVIVPGMRGFWARFAPGRLYDVPVRLGRLPQPTSYDNLNPYPLFL